MAEALTAEAERRGIAVILYPSDKPSSVVFEGITVTTSAIHFLDRSVQPLCTITVEGNGTLLYVGGGVPESLEREEMLAIARRTHVTLLGVHGPLIKAPLRASLSGTVLLANETVGKDYAVAGYLVRDGNTFYRLLVFQKIS